MTLAYAVRAQSDEILGFLLSSPRNLQSIVTECAH